MHNQPTQFHYQSLDSTMNETWRLLANKTSPPFWVFADEQTQGRGRRERKWVSLSGNCHASFAFVLAENKNAQAGQLPLVMGLVVLKAIKSLAPQADLKLKWPNDVMLSGKKLAGLIIERQNELCVVGIGINRVAHPLDIAQHATNLHAEGLRVDLADLHMSLINHMQEELIIWQRQADFEAMKQQWLSHATGLGQEICVSMPNHDMRGFFEGLEDDGRLILRQNTGTIKLIAAGDVFFPAQIE